MAERAGLSPATVSRVLNKSGYFSEEAQRRVEEAIDELGYRPNWMARGLRGKPSQLVGLVIPDLSNVFYTALAEAVIQVLRQKDYEMVMCVNDEDFDIDLAYLQILEEKNVDGVIYVHPSRGSNSEYLQALVARGACIVEINRQREKSLLDAVLSDNIQAIERAVKHLVENGHTQIALISGDDSISTGSERIQGYKNAIRNAGLPFVEDDLKINTFSRAFGEQATRALLDLPHPPTAIIAGSNRIVLGVLWVINQRKLQIPHDVSIVTVDDAEWLTAWNPPITAIDIAIDEMGQLAVDLLLKLIKAKADMQKNEAHKPVTYRLSTTLNKRQSVADLSKPGR